MLSITEFSRLSGLPVKTLRHYHAKGVLIPRHVDEHTQYRWYGVEQVAVATQISAMRRAGMSLAEVRGLLEDVDLVPDALRHHRDRLERERSEQDSAAAELDDTAAGTLAPRIRPRAPRAVLTALGPWRRGDVESLTVAQWEQEAEELRLELVDLAAERGLEDAGHWWSALEVDGEATAQCVGLPLRDGTESRDSPDRIGDDLPDNVRTVRDEPADEVVIPLRPGAAEASARQAMIAVLSFASAGRIADPRTLRYLEQDGGDREFTAVLIDDPRPDEVQEIP